MLRGAAFGSNVYLWPGGGGEAVVYFDHAAGSDLPERSKRNRGERGRAADPVRSCAESLRRARSKVRRLARHGSYRIMLTLTVPGQGVHSISGANALLTSWMNSGNAGIRGGASAKFFGGAYLAFPERHKRHGWHWHILTNRRIDSRAVQVSWTRHCHLLGHSSVTSLHARVHTKDFGSSRSAAAYASKYVGKAIDQVSDEMGRHRYRVGEAVEAPVPSYDLVMGADVHEAAWTVLGPYVHLQPRVCHVSGAGPPAVWAGW